MPANPDIQTRLDRESFTLWLVERHPGLKPIFDEHLSDYEDLLAHLFFADVTRFYEKLCSDGLLQDATALVADLDVGLRDGDEDIDNVIHVSFLENLGHEKGRAVWELLTPRLKEGFDLIHGYKTSQ